MGNRKLWNTEQVSKTELFERDVAADPHICRLEEESIRHLLSLSECFVRMLETIQEENLDKQLDLRTKYGTTVKGLQNKKAIKMHHVFLFLFFS